MNTQPIRSLPITLNDVYLQPIRRRLTLPLVKLNWQFVLTGAALLGIFVAVLAIIQFSTPNLFGNDGYFHIRFAQVMRQQGLRPPFVWLPLTILNSEAYFDHHFLFHILMIPFTYGDLREGAKWMSVIFPAITFMTGWILLRGQRVPYASLWSLGFLAMSDAFLYRMEMARVQAVSLMMIFLILHVTLTRRYRWLLPLSFLYVWLYDAFPFIMVLVGMYVMLHWLLDGQLELRPLIYVGLGIGLGLLINPYFPNNVVFIYHHFLPKVTSATEARVGSEWYPYKTWTLVENSGPALLAFAAGAFAMGLNRRRIDTRMATLFLTAILFGFLLLKSRRFVEYYPAFALLFCAVAWGPLLTEWLQTKRWLNKALPVMLTLLLIPAIWLNVERTREQVQDSKPYERYAEASAWLTENTPAGSRVFQTDWDDFTQLYFYNTHNTYTLGLDPTYMQLYDAKMYELWVDISRGRVETPAQTITETFGAGYILTDLKHKDFLREAETDPRLTEVFRDEYAAIFQVVGQSNENGRKGG